MMMGLLMTISCSLFALCNTLTTDDECAHHATLAASMLSVGAMCFKDRFCRVYGSCLG